MFWWNTARCDEELQETTEREQTVTDFRIDDIVICKLVDGSPVSRSDSEYDCKMSFKIIGQKETQFSAHEFVLYVPDYQIGDVRPNGRVSRKVMKEYDVDPRFDGDNMLYVRKSQIVNVESRLNGCRCCHCQEIFDMAEPNQEDDTFRCRACTENPYR